MKKLILLTASLFIFFSCSNDSNTQGETFNTPKMLTEITETIIIPKINNFKIACDDLNTNVSEYIQNPTENNLTQIQISWKTTASAYAQIYAFNIGEAKNRYFHQSLYYWPTFSIAIENFINNTVVITADNVAQLSPQAKTLSGIEYLLFNGSPSDVHQEFTNSPKRLDFLKFIVLSQKEKAENLYNLWHKSGENYANSFINNSEIGLDSSINMLFNGVYNVVSTAKITKVGKSAGLENSNNVNFDELQAKYSGYSKALIIENLKSVKDVFFNPNGLGLSDNVASITGNQIQNDALLIKIDTAIASLNNLNGTLAESITNAHDQVSSIHQQLQGILIIIGVDIRSTLSIIITSTDNDGD